MWPSHITLTSRLCFWINVYLKTHFTIHSLQAHNSLMTMWLSFHQIFNFTQKHQAQMVNITVFKTKYFDTVLPLQCMCFTQNRMICITHNNITISLSFSSVQTERRNTYTLHRAQSCSLVVWWPTLSCSITMTVCCW